MQHFLRILHEKLVPWAEAGAAGRMVVARRRMKAMDLPPGVELAYRKIPGERVIVKGARKYGNTRHAIAEYPEAIMHELNVPRMICVAENRVNFQAGNYVLGCGPGDFIFLPPGTPHEGNGCSRAVTCSEPGQTCTLMFMTLYKSGVQCWLSRYTNDSLRPGTPTENYLFLHEQVIQLFRLFASEISGERNLQLCNSLLLAFAIAMQREVKMQRYLYPGVSVEVGAPAAPGTDFVDEVTKFVQQHIAQPLRIEQVARELYMSPTQFMRRMRQETGKSFVEFLTAYRIEEAKNLLRESEWTVNTIASIFGFTSSTYFHALFKRQVGCTPNEFRTQNRASKNK